VKNQEKTQDMQEPQEKYQGMLKRIFQRKDWTAQNCPREFFNKYLLQEFLLSSNRLPEAQNIL